MDAGAFAGSAAECAARCRAEAAEAEAIVFDVLHSADGAHLISGASTGRVAVVDVGTMLRSKGGGATTRWFRAHESCIYKLLLVPDGSVLVTGSATEIRLWRWADVRARLSSGEAPTHFLQLDPGCETNGLAYDAQGGCLLAATGDGLCHVYDAARGQETAALSGHANYLHSVAVLPESRRVATASEDGTVRLWDMRSGYAAAGVLEPFSDPGSAGRERTAARRTVSTEWVSCLACDPTENWLVCGGSAHYLNIFHIASLKSMKKMPTASQTQAVSFVEGMIVSVGAEQGVYHHSIGGALVARVPSSCPSNYGMSFCAKPRLLVTCGASTSADVFTDFTAPPTFAQPLRCTELG